MITLKKTVREEYYYYEFVFNGSKRGLEIIFRDGKFQECIYNLPSKYDYEGWMMIREFANEIERLQKQYTKSDGPYPGSHIENKDSA